MAEVRPFKALRYTAAAGSLGDLVAPPYDVISPERQQSLYDRSEHNIVRVEYGTTLPGDTPEANRYTRAAALVRDWRAQGVLAEDGEPALYVYAQSFDYAGQAYRRTGVMAAVRLEPLDAGIVKPHEFTMTGPKEDRFQLLRAVRVNTSPVFGMVRDGAGALRSFIDNAMRGAPDATATDDLGQSHTLWRIAGGFATAALTAALHDEAIYIADGHHRYETALRYRDEVAPTDADHPANFVLMAIVPVDDPGLVIRPIHRLVNPASGEAELQAALAQSWDVRATPDGVAGLVQRMAGEAASNTVFGLVHGGGLAHVALRDAGAVEGRMPADIPAAARQLDVNRLQYGILEPFLGIGAFELASGDYVRFTEDAEEAAEAVAAGHCRLAFLVNATRAEQVLAVADTGARMPQKSTFFYPKLGTGLVMRSLA